MELSKLLERVTILVKEGIEELAAKINVLIQGSNSHRGRGLVTQK